MIISSVTVWFDAFKIRARIRIISLSLFKFKQASAAEKMEKRNEEKNQISSTYTETVSKLVEVIYTDSHVPYDINQVERN